VNAAMRSAAWDESVALWRVTTANGADFQARVLVSAVGALHVPLYPKIKGAEQFAGPAFHSTDWDASVQLAGNASRWLAPAPVHSIRSGDCARSGQTLCLPAHAALDRPKSDFAIPERWRKRFRKVSLIGWIFRKRYFCCTSCESSAFSERMAAHACSRHRPQAHGRTGSDPALRAQLLQL